MRLVQLACWLPGDYVFKQLIEEFLTVATRGHKKKNDLQHLLEESLKKCRTREGMVSALKDAMNAGVLPPGTRLPSVRKLQALSGMRYHSAYRAIETLAAEGWVEQRHGSGTYAAERNGTVLQADKSELRIGILPPAWDPEFARYAMAQYFGGISAQADLKHRVQIVPPRVAAADPSEFISYIRYLHLDGLIWIKPPVAPPLQLVRLYDAGIPVVLIGRSYQQLPVTTADYDHQAAGRAVAQFMVKYKRQKLICMAGVRNDHQTDMQVKALRDALNAEGYELPDSQVVTVRIESAAQVYTLDLRDSIIRHFQDHPDFDVVFSLHPDQVAVLQHLHESGFRRCPDDFIHLHYGYYNNFFGGRPCPAFPSAFLGLPSVEVGRQAVVELEMLLGVESETEPPNCKPDIVHDPY